MKEKKKLNQNTFLLLVTILLFFVMYAIGCVLFNAQGFAKTQNFLNLFISNAGLIVIGIGMTIVMITGGIDISVGSFVAMGCMMLAWMMEKGGIGAVPAVLIVLVTGIVFGLVQGFLVAYMDIQPFIVTLAGMFFARGMTAIISKDMISITNETFMAWAKMKLYIPFGGYLNKKGVMIYPYIYPTVVIALVLLALTLIVNIANFVSTNRDINEMLDLIYEGPDPGTPAEKPQTGPETGRPMLPQEPPKGPFNQETPYSMRYFTLTLDADGTVADGDFTHIASVTQQSAIAYAAAALRHGKGYGFYSSSCKFLVTAQENGQYLAIFLDCYQ